MLVIAKFSNRKPEIKLLLNKPVANLGSMRVHKQAWLV
jgi:hypothetical protein